MKSELFNKTFGIIINNPSITFTLVLFLILSNIFAVLAATSQVKLTAFILSLCAALLFIVFLPGWFQILRESTDIERIKDKNYMGIFFEGIGKNIISVLIGFCLYMFILFIFLIVSGYAAQKLFGNLDFMFSDLSVISQNESAIIDYFKNLPEDKLITISGWQICLFIGYSIFNFLFLFYCSALIFNDKNNQFVKPFRALIDSICFLFKNFWQAILIYIFINLVLVILNLSGTIFAHNEIIRILLLFISIYFISYSVMLIFNYYEQKNCCNNWCYCDGENQNSDSPFEEN